MSNNYRSLSVIASEIKKDWQKVYFGAVPYLDAMRSLDSIDGRYYEDSAKSVVNYFLANAQSWRGEKAKAIKAELKAMVAGKAVKVVNPNWEADAVARNERNAGA